MIVAGGLSILIIGSHIVAKLMTFNSEKMLRNGINCAIKKHTGYEKYFEDMLEDVEFNVYPGTFLAEWLPIYNVYKAYDTRKVINGQVEALEDKLVMQNHKTEYSNIIAKNTETGEEIRLKVPKTYFVGYFEGDKPVCIMFTYDGLDITVKEESAQSFLALPGEIQMFKILSILNNIYRGNDKDYMMSNNINELFDEVLISSFEEYFGGIAKEKGPHLVREK